MIPWSTNWSSKDSIGNNFAIPKSKNTEARSILITVFIGYESKKSAIEFYDTFHYFSLIYREQDPPLAAAEVL